MTMQRFLVLLGALTVAGCATAPAQAPVTTTAASTAASTRAAVSSAHPLATEAGLAMLRMGGTAADAALATMVALTVVEPQSSGIGGGGFLLYNDADDGLVTLDGREIAPASATPTMFLDAGGAPLPRDKAVPGGRSVGVPGNLRLMAEAHARWGALPWAKVFEPAIRLAEQGYPLSPRGREFLERFGARLADYPPARALYFDAAGQLLPVGHVIRNPALAATLRALAEGGAEAFYRGPNARALIAAVGTAQNNPTIMTDADLAGYRVVARAPLCGEYRSYRICGMGPPSHGGIGVLTMLKQLERFDLSKLGPDSAQSWHLIAESMRLAYADRDRWSADPAFTPVPVAGVLDADYIRQRSALIRADARMASVAAGTPAGAPAVAAAPAQVEQGTSHLVVVDATGNVASLTSTIEGPFGSGLIAGGYFLNNELTDFAFQPVQAGVPVANSAAPGKRPRSAMSPTIVYDRSGKPVLAIGAAGGATIIAQVAKTLIGVIDWKLDAASAIALPQIVASGDTVRIEQGSALERHAAALEALGHTVQATRLPLKINAAEWTGEGWRGVADPRGEGAAGGL